MAVASLTAAAKATVALTTRMLPSDVRPLSARELWAFSRQINLDEVGSDGWQPQNDRDRIGSLLGRSMAVALALEQLDHAGIWTLTAFDEAYPSHLRVALGDDAPAVLHGAGDVALLATPGLGVVGSRRLSPEAAVVAGAVAKAGVDQGWPVVSGAAKGTDRLAMDGALQSGGCAVGVLADSLVRALSVPENRSAVTAARTVLLTPYAPSAGFTAGMAMGRNKIIYGLSRGVVVVAADKDTGGTWAGATEAIKHGWGRVLVWTGSAAGEGNAALLAHGGVTVSSVDEILTAISSAPSAGATSPRSIGDSQLALEI